MAVCHRHFHAELEGSPAVLTIRDNSEVTVVHFDNLLANEKA